MLTTVPSAFQSGTVHTSQYTSGPGSAQNVAVRHQVHEVCPGRTVSAERRVTLSGHGVTSRL